jgi:cell cycle checkpoint protein
VGSKEKRRDCGVFNNLTVVANFARGVLSADECKATSCSEITFTLGPFLSSILKEFLTMSTSNINDDATFVFKAVSSSARQLFQLLNCIRFAPKVDVRITGEGIRFAVEDSRVMQGR